MKNADILSRASLDDVQSILPFLRQGQLNYFIEDKGRIRGVVSAELVNASIDRVWDVLTDFDNYVRHLPGFETSHVLSRTPKEVRARFALGVRVMGIGGTVRYTYRYKLDKPHIDAIDEAVGDTIGLWHVYPVPGEPKRSVLYHANVAKSMRDAHVFVRFLIDKLPPAEYGFHLAPIAMLVKGLRRWAEGLQ